MFFGLNNLMRNRKEINRRSKGKGGEDKIELAFRAKRANVFTVGVEVGAQDSIIQKRIAKSAKQSSLIRKSYLNLTPYELHLRTFYMPQ